MERNEKTKLDNFYFQRGFLASVHERSLAEFDPCAMRPCFEGKELKQQPPCIEEAGSRTNRQNTRGPAVQPPARFEGYRLPLSDVSTRNGISGYMAENYE